MLPNEQQTATNKKYSTNLRFRASSNRNNTKSFLTTKQNQLSSLGKLDKNNFLTSDSLRHSLTDHLRQVLECRRNVKTARGGRQKHRDSTTVQQMDQAKNSCISEAQHDFSQSETQNQTSKSNLRTRKRKNSTKFEFLSG